MHIKRNFFGLGAATLCAAGLARAATPTTYVLKDNYNSTNFFDQFTFFTEADPTGGFVSYKSAAAANNTALAGYSYDGVYMGVDYTTINPPGGRASVRVTSKKAYTKGLFIADIAHMPGSICGAWPAFWTVGPDWPNQGEIDIIEGVNADSTTAITLHTSPGCNMASTNALKSSSLVTQNCNAMTAFQGCSFSTKSTQGYGNGFNAIGGGVYAMEWTSSVIRVFFFPRTAIPVDITSNTPNPSTWGVPVASFSGSGCDIDSHFKNHNIVFDTTFCGQWAGNVWNSGSCASKAPTCQEYVAQNPQAFAEAYWLVKSVKVYQQSEASKRDVTALPFQG